MTKNLKLSYIFLFIFSAVLVAWSTLSNFFGGVAINFVAIVGLVFVIMLLSFTDKDLMKRIKDLFIIACVFCFLELIVYFACEFGYGERLIGFIVYQNILSFLGLLFLAYTCFRFVTEFRNKKIKFVETMLGNEKRTVKAKKKKELSNGSLLDKPNNKTSVETNNQPQSNDEDKEETVIVVETDDEI